MLWIDQNRLSPRAYQDSQLIATKARSLARSCALACICTAAWKIGWIGYIRELILELRRKEILFGELAILRKN